MSYTRRAVRGTIIVFTISILAAFIGYLIRMVLARNLTPAEYGLFFSVFTLISLLASFKSLGLGEALVKYIPEFVVKRKLALIKNSIFLVIGFNLLSSLILSAVLFISSGYLAVHYFKDSLAVPVLSIFIIIFILAIFKDTLRNLFNAFQRMVPFSLMYLMENLLILIFILIFFAFGFKIFSPLFAYVAAYLLLFIIFFPFFLKIYPLFKYKFKFSKELSKTLFKFGIPVMIGGVGGIILLYTDTLVLTYFRPLSEVGIYNAVVPTAMLLNFFSMAVSQVIFPMVSELWAKKLNSHVSYGAYLLQKYSFAVIIPVALVIFSFPQITLRLLFGEAYVSGALALQLLVVGLVFFVVAGINMAILSGIGKPGTSTKILLIGALVNLITNFYFIPRWGMVGAAITSLFSYFLIMVLSVVYLKRFVELKVPLLSWVKTLFASILFILIIFVLKKFLETNVYMEAVICILISSLIYLFLVWILKVIDIKEIKGLILSHTK